MTRIHIHTTIEQKLDIADRLEKTNGAAKFEIQAEYGFHTVRSVWVVYQQIRGMTFSAAGYGCANGYGALQRKKAQRSDAERQCQSKNRKGKTTCARCGILASDELCEDCLNEARDARLIRYADDGGDDPYRSPVYMFPLR